MSRTKIPPKVQLEVWLRAGGRCQYPGCNVPLWKDELTLAQLNRAYLAHIIADRPTGPRGDPTLSEELKADPSNIMLMCDVHHRLIDREDIEGHPVELLHHYKAEHEERIEHQTAIQASRRTEIVLFGTRIKDRTGLVSSEQARIAVLPERYPASEAGIRIDLADIQLNEDDPEFWSMATMHTERMLAIHLAHGEGPTGRPINHVSVFALAPIPLLIHFGKALGDIISADIYQRHRGEPGWRWQELSEEDEGFNYTVIRPEPTETKAPRVAVNLSLSGTIHATEIERAAGGQIPTYILTIARPCRDFLHAKEQLELFRSEWYRLLAEIRETHGDTCEIHLFPAIPNAIAVEIGRSLLPKSDPHLVIYDQDKDHSGFRTILTL